MANIYILTDIFTYGLKENILVIVSIISVILSTLVVIVKNPIVSILFLIGLFLAISIYLITLGFFFLGLSYILVYIGAVSILFIFILMLINIRLSELLSETKNSIYLAIIITVLIYTIVSEFIPSNFSDFNNYRYIYKQFFNYTMDTTHINYASSESWDSHLIGTDFINTIGSVLYTNYSIWLILTSVILLLAMVGCIVITMRQR